MARIRSMKPEYPKDELMGSLSRDARLLYPLLWLIADDEGHFRACSAIIKAECFPYDEDLGLKDVRRILEELIKAARVLEYEVEGQKYGFMPNFLKHQRIDRPSKFRFPPHPDEKHTSIVGGTRDVLVEPSASPQRGLPAGLGWDGKRKGRGGDADPPGSTAQQTHPDAHDQPAIDLAAKLSSALNEPHSECLKATRELLAAGLTEPDLASRIAAIDHPIGVWTWKHSVEPSRQRDFSPASPDSNGLLLAQLAAERLKRDALEAEFKASGCATLAEFYEKNRAGRKS